MSSKQETKRDVPIRPLSFRLLEEQGYKGVTAPGQMHGTRASLAKGWPGRSSRRPDSPGRQP